LYNATASFNFSLSKRNPQGSSTSISSTSSHFLPSGAGFRNSGHSHEEGDSEGDPVDLSTGFFVFGFFVALGGFVAVGGLVFLDGFFFCCSDWYLWRLFS
jgi:hypothetical protein